MRIKFFSLFFFFLFLSSLYAQEYYDYNAEVEETVEETVNEEPPEPVIRRSQSEINRLEMEIRTSTLGELAIWCRSLGLSEGGTRADLARRLRDYFGLDEPADNDNEDRRVITIESAQTTEYFTIDVIDEDYARLRGDVLISLRDGDEIHRIRADEILFNRTRNIITARGGVIYERISPDQTETFRGENITVNIDTWASVFLDGSSTFDSEGTAYLFSGVVISRTDEDVTILRNAQITSADNDGDEAFWSISASRLWLLPGSDFAILNAILRVGNIPVLYIPFFFFPTDELIFHPVIGYRNREGGFIQTTTHIMGRPRVPTGEQSSLSRILGAGQDMDREREGLFLRSTGRRVVDTNEISLRAMIDYYVNLGFFLGVDLRVPPSRVLDTVDLSVGLGFTRTLQRISTGYSPYAANNFDGTFDWNRSNFFSIEVPFRYRIRFNSSISGGLGRLTWNFILNSDPFVDSDFLNRAESMDWVNMIQQGAAIEDTLGTQAEASASSFSVTANLNRSITRFAPFISNMSLSGLTTSLSFVSIRDPSINEWSPNRIFFAPDRWLMYRIGGSITGNPLNIGAARARPAPAPDPEIDDPLRGIGIPISPWQRDDVTAAPPADAPLTPPILRQTFALPRTGNVTFTVNYSISPNSTSELQFMRNNWITAEDVDWSEIQSILTDVQGTVNFNLRLAHTTGLFSTDFRVSTVGTWRDFTFLNEEAYTDAQGVIDTDRMERDRRNQIRQTNYRSSYTYNTRIQPFFNNPIFQNTNFTHSFGGTLVRSRTWTEESGTSPELRPNWGSWVREERVDGEIVPGLTSHQVATNVVANIMNQNQNLTFSAVLPPLDGDLRANATVRFWITETVVNTRFERLTERHTIPPDRQEGEWIFRPITIRQTLRFPNNFGTSNFNMTIDPENDYEITALSAGLTLRNFRANFSANHVRRWFFDPNDPARPYLGGTWRQPPADEEEPSLRPRDLSFSYSRTFREIDVVRNLISMNLNFSTSLTFDLQRHTNSRFNISYGFTTRIRDFLNLTLSATSSNAVIMRYFKNVPGFERFTFMYIDGPQNNVFRDLWDSFAFWDEAARRRSGFKLDRFNLHAVHNLGDWEAVFTVNMSPFFRPDARSWEFVTDFSFLLQWRPITEIRSSIRYEGRHDRWIIEE